MITTQRFTHNLHAQSVGICVYIISLRQKDRSNEGAAGTRDSLIGISIENYISITFSRESMTNEGAEGTRDIDSMIQRADVFDIRCIMIKLK